MGLSDDIGGMIVAEYITRKNLCELGYVFDSSNLYDWEVEAYTIITNRIGELDKQARKTKGRN